MDIMVLSQSPVVPGCVLAVRPIAFVNMKDEAGVDNKILAVPEKDPSFEKIVDLDDVPSSVLNQIRHFLEHYKDLEKEKWVKVESWDHAAIAKREIQNAMALFKEKNK
jgi:inorganic pyrophosphatase